jgi:hypothetical protein
VPAIARNTSCLQLALTASNTSRLPADCRAGVSIQHGLPRACGTRRPAASACLSGPSSLPSRSRQLAVTVALSGLRARARACRRPRRGGTRRAVVRRRRAAMLREVRVGERILLALPAGTCSLAGAGAPPSWAPLQPSHGPRTVCSASSNETAFARDEAPRHAFQGRRRRQRTARPSAGARARRRRAGRRTCQRTRPAATPSRPPPSAAAGRSPARAARHPATGRTPARPHHPPRVRRPGAHTAALPRLSCM